MSVLLEPLQFQSIHLGGSGVVSRWASRFWGKNANPRHNRSGLRGFGPKSRTPDTNAHPGGLGFEVSAQNREPQPQNLEAQARNLEPKPQSLHAYLRSPEPQEEDYHEVNIFAGRMKWGIVGGGYGGDSAKRCPLTARSAAR